MRYIIAAHQGTFVLDPDEDLLPSTVNAATRLAEYLANASQSPAIVHRQPLNFLPQTVEIYTARGGRP